MARLESRTGLFNDRPTRPIPVLHGVSTEVVEASRSSMTDSPEGKPVPWDPSRVRQFMAGEITLGELEGISKDSQYEMAQFGFRFLQQGKLKDARKVFEGLVALDPTDAYFYLVLGSIAQRNGDLEEADRCYTLSLKNNPYSASALANRGEVRVILGRFDTGLADLEKALQEDPKAVEPATQRARALLPSLKARLAERRDASEAPTDGQAPTYSGHRLAKDGGVPDVQFASDDANREGAATALMNSPEPLHETLKDPPVTRKDAPASRGDVPVTQKAPPPGAPRKKKRRKKPAPE